MSHPQMSNPNALLHRRDVVNELVRDRGDLLVIAGLGAPNWDVSAVGDHPNNFPLWGAMGSAAMIGLGLALAQPKRKVLVITGDGEMLMNLGSLATIAVEAPPNLMVAVLDNERFGETGMQKTHTAAGVDLAAMAAAAGIRTSRIVRTPWLTKRRPTARPSSSAPPDVRRTSTINFVAPPFARSATSFLT